MTVIGIHYTLKSHTMCSQTTQTVFIPRRFNTSTAFLGTRSKLNSQQQIHIFEDTSQGSQAANHLKGEGEVRLTQLTF